MCVIVFKPAGAETPPIATLKKCWDSNPDGAGVSVSGESAVFLRKGFMTFEDLLTFYSKYRLDKRIRQAIVFHFRIGTHGAKDAGNTHPFPVSGDPAILRALEGNYPKVVAHNGIFKSVPVLPEVSDTGQFLADCATASNGDPIEHWNKNPLTTNFSRMIVLSPGGRYTLLGTWHCDKEASGCFFSNLTWSYGNFSYGGGGTTYNGCGYRITGGGTNTPATGQQSFYGADGRWRGRGRGVRDETDRLNNWFASRTPAQQREDEEKRAEASAYSWVPGAGKYTNEKKDEPKAAIVVKPPDKKLPIEFTQPNGETWVQCPDGVWRKRENIKDSPAKLQKVWTAEGGDKVVECSD